MTERDKIIGLASTMKTTMTSRSPFTLRSQRRYDLTEMMNNSRQRMVSPAMHKDGGSKLNADSLRQLPGTQEGRGSPEELQSVRSKRSLSINVNKVSKIVKL